MKKGGAWLLALLLCAGCGAPEAPAEEDGAVLLERAGVPLAEGETIRDWTSGDLGNDGVPDWAVVVDGAAPESDGDFAATPRTLYLLSETAEGDLVLTHKSGGILMGKEYGGVWGDPYLGVDFPDGNLEVSDYGGSSSRWGHVYTFVPEGEDLVLAKIIEVSSSTHTGNGVTSAYDLTAGTAEETTFSYAMEDYQPLTLYRGTFPPVRIRLEDAAAWQEGDLDCTPRDPLPWLVYYDYFRKLDPVPVHSAEKILDIVHREKHPELKRVEMSCGKELLDNWSQALGYDVPHYYYAGDGAVLSYAEIEGRYGTDWKHTVLYREADGNTDFYWYWDTSGEERTFD